MICLRQEVDHPRWPAQRSQDTARLVRIALAIALALLATWMWWAFLPAAGRRTWPLYNL